MLRWLIIFVLGAIAWKCIEDKLGVKKPTIKI